MIDVVTDPDRLAALEASGLLAKDVLGRLNHLTYSAVQITGGDASQINVLGGEWQNTIAAYPVPLPDPYPVEQSGCQEVIRQDDTIVIPDTAAHPLTCNLPWVQVWRGYLGAPIHHDGEPIGAMCLLSATPREWRQHDVLALAGFVRLVMLSIDPHRR